ncbi:hypothetical protein HPB48_004077 [Haemaphysalis longicornis]|uniref:Peptidase M13 N-terminal domain-containing protein n=1 Tax=Haemaphysalis longicornis TaxID=44386 RepID=A0A9J6GY78_HAELO|nr:hypothetical protein HPB48_004077 [Haemaphysalis longicornis]
MIKLLAMANKSMASHHGHVFVRKNRLLSTLRTVCNSRQCQQYSWELQSSLDINCNPCHSLYGFVCGRWRRGNTVPSIRKAAEARLTRQVLRSVLELNASEVDSVTTTADKVAALVHSCLHGRREPAELAAFLRARRILPYRQRSPHDLLGVLVDLSVNWGVHLWFELHMGSRGNGTPAVYIGRSKALAEWAAMVKKIRKTRAYRRRVQNTLKMFELPVDQQPAMVDRDTSLDTLISTASGIGNSTSDAEPLEISVGTMAVLLTPSIPVRAWLDALSSVQPPEINITRGTLVHVDSPSVLQAMGNLFDHGARMQYALQEHIAYRTILHLGWMVDDRNASSRGQPPPWPTDPVPATSEGDGGACVVHLVPVADGDTVLKRAILGSLRATGSLPAGIAAPSESSVSADVLPPLQPSFFGNWVAYKEARRHLMSLGIYNILGIGGIQDLGWNRELNLTVDPLLFSYPFFHTELHPVINYAGAGRILARSLLEVTSSDTSEKSLEAVAVHAALRALHEGVETKAGDAPGFPTTAFVDELFFMASCYSVCATDDANKTVQMMCDEPVMQLPSFIAAFGCNLSPESRRWPQEERVNDSFR